jgi:putative endonuclease
MICTYILECNDNTFYVGSTGNLDDRLVRHKRGECRYTKSRLPFKLAYTKEFATVKEARSYEYFIKRQRNKEFYKKLIQAAFV